MIAIIDAFPTISDAPKYYAAGKTVSTRQQHSSLAARQGAVLHHLVARGNGNQPGKGMTAGVIAMAGAAAQSHSREVSTSNQFQGSTSFPFNLVASTDLVLWHPMDQGTSSPNEKKWAPVVHGCRSTCHNSCASPYASLIVWFSAHDDISKNGIQYGFVHKFHQI